MEKSVKSYIDECAGEYTGKFLNDENRDLAFVLKYDNDARDYGVTLADCNTSEIVKLLKLSYPEVSCLTIESPFDVSNSSYYRLAIDDDLDGENIVIDIKNAELSFEINIERDCISLIDRSSDAKRFVDYIKYDDVKLFKHNGLNGAYYPKEVKPIDNPSIDSVLEAIYNSFERAIKNDVLYDVNKNKAEELFNRVTSIIRLAIDKIFFAGWRESLQETADTARDMLSQLDDDFKAYEAHYNNTRANYVRAIRELDENVNVVPSEETRNITNRR